MKVQTRARGANQFVFVFGEVAGILEVRQAKRCLICEIEGLDCAEIGTERLLKLGLAIRFRTARVVQRKLVALKGRLTFVDSSQRFLLSFHSRLFFPLLAYRLGEVFDQIVSIFDRDQQRLLA